MHMRLICLLLLILGCPVLAAEDISWQKRHAEGWAWYHDFKKEKEKSKKLTQPQDPIVLMKECKEELERTLSKAMLEPTKENILTYMVLQKKWTHQAALFARVWQLNILENPELAHMKPTTQYGVQIEKEMDAIKRRKIIHALSKKYHSSFLL